MKISDLVPWKKSDLNGGSRVESPFLSLQREMNALFDNFFADMERWPTWQESPGLFSPRVNVTENDDALVVSAEVPGIEPDDIDVSLVHDALTIKGEKRREVEEKNDDRHFYRMERSYGAFTRTIPLPLDVIDRDHIEASFKNGVLTITLPKVAPAPTVKRRIEVKAG